MIILRKRQELFEENLALVGFAIKSVGAQGVKSVYNVTGEINGFRKAEGVKAANMGALANLVRPSGITTGTAQGIMTTTDGDSVVWKLSYAGNASGVGGKLTAR